MTCTVAHLQLVGDGGDGDAAVAPEGEEGFDAAAGLGEVVLAACAMMSTVLAIFCVPPTSNIAARYRNTIATDFIADVAIARVV